MEAHSQMASVFLFIQGSCLCSDANRLNTSFQKTVQLSLTCFFLFYNLFLVATHCRAGEL